MASLTAACAALNPLEGTVGLYGGSFNPVHAGHLAMAHMAFKRLALTRLLWLLSPQNPLKNPQDTQPYAVRRHALIQALDHPRFMVCEVEAALATTKTYPLLRALAPVLAHKRVVWLMGADCFAQLHRWAHWEAIMHALPIAVCARPGFCLHAMGGKAATVYQSAFIPTGQAATLARRPAPAWTFLPMPLRFERSSALRSERSTPNTLPVF